MVGNIIKYTDNMGNVLAYCWFERGTWRLLKFWIDVLNKDSKLKDNERDSDKTWILVSGMIYSSFATQPSPSNPMQIDMYDLTMNNV